MFQFSIFKFKFNYLLFKRMPQGSSSVQSECQYIKGMIEESYKTQRVLLRPEFSKVATGDELEQAPIKALNHLRKLNFSFGINPKDFSPEQKKQNKFKMKILQMYKINSGFKGIIL